MACEEMLHELLEGRIERQRGLSREHLLSNVRPDGAILTSTSRMYPDYYHYLWPRDLSIAIAALVRLGEYSKAERGLRRLFELQRGDGTWHQRYCLDGTPAQGNWAEPQHDQFALPTISCLEYYNATGDEGLLRELYPLIARTCEFLLKDKSPTWDVWEQVCSYHYWTIEAIIKAMEDGSRIAAVMGKAEEASRYGNEALRLIGELKNYFVRDGYITCEARGGAYRQGASVPGKGLVDASVLGAHLYFDGHHLGHPLVRRTVAVLEEAFAFYPINWNGARGKAIGRYPEDPYDGIWFTGGNPWYITTLWFAEWHYSQGDLRRGDEYLKVVLDHIPRDGHIYEQFNRVTGAPQGARDLSWSYAQFLRAVDARRGLIALR